MVLLIQSSLSRQDIGSGNGMIHNEKLCTGCVIVVQIDAMVSAAWLIIFLVVQIQAAYLCNTRQLRPRVSIKSEDDFLSSDEEKGTGGGCYDPLDEMPRIVPGEDSPLFCPFPFSNTLFFKVAPSSTGIDTLSGDAFAVQTPQAL